MPRAKMDGTVKTLHVEKGFGFIAGVDGQQYFFHRSAAEDFDALVIGDAVRFEAGMGTKGPRAEAVERA